MFLVRFKTIATNRPYEGMMWLWLEGKKCRKRNHKLSPRSQFENGKYLLCSKSSQDQFCRGGKAEQPQQTTHANEQKQKQLKHVSTLLTVVLNGSQLAKMKK